MTLLPALGVVAATTASFPPPPTPPAIADLGSSTNISAVTTVVSPSVSPAAGSLLIAARACRGNVLTTATLSTTLSNVGAWTVYKTSSGINAHIIVAVAQITGAPGTGTVTIQTDLTQSRNVLDVLEVTGYDTAAPIRQSITGNNTATSLTLTLPSAPLVGSLIVGIIAARSSGATPDPIPGSGFTELMQLDSGNTNPPVYEVQTTSGVTVAQIPWTGLGNTNAAVGLEIAGP